ncbi:MAG: hypothetical protein ACXABY_25130 [Candidatus Thorarchaeota archaeon]
MVEDRNLETLYSKTNEGTTLTTDTPELDERTHLSNLRTSLAFIRTIDAEKRTHLAELRTGIGILTIPFSLLTILIATSSYYSINDVLPLITGLAIGIIVLLLIGAHLVFYALRKIRGDDRLRAACDDLSGLVSEFNHHD